MDHVHLLISLAKTATVADVLEEIKRDTSSWIKAKDRSLTRFRWQEGYGAFTIGQSQVGAIERYFARQKQHHRRTTFKEELVALLRKYEVEYDERYIWT